MTTESKEQIAREAATDFVINGWQIYASLRELAIETLTKQILSAIEQAKQQWDDEVRKPLVEALERIRDESTALANAREFPNSVLHIESPLRIKREANDALANAREQ